MNELKPKDVMRALECCGRNVGSNCHDCPYCGLSPWSAQCRLVLAKDALALLREKDAKIAELQSIAEYQQSSNMNRYFELQKKDAEIERLTAYNANLICANTDITNRHKDYVEEAERIARRDTITEFAERLGKWFSHDPAFLGVERRLVLDVVEQIAKEMKEDQE